MAKIIKRLKTGTTTVGLTCKDGVVFASDKRATMGSFIASREVDKIYKIDDTLGMTVAGGVGDAQALVRILQAEVNLYKYRMDKPMSAKAAAMILANLLQNYKFFPFYVQLLIGGTSEQNEIYSLDAFGGSTREKMAATGSGSPIAYGLLESEFDEDSTVEDNISLAARAVSIAMKRDSATGEGIEIVTLTKNGYKRYSKDEVQKILMK